MCFLGNSIFECLSYQSDCLFCQKKTIVYQEHCSEYCEWFIVYLDKKTLKTMIFVWNTDKLFKSVWPLSSTTFCDKSELYTCLFFVYLSFALYLCQYLCHNCCACNICCFFLSGGVSWWDSQVYAIKMWFYIFLF